MLKRSVTMRFSGGQRRNFSKESIRRERKKKRKRKTVPATELSVKYRNRKLIYATFSVHNTCCTIINSHGRREVWFNYCCQRVMHRLSRWLIRSYSISPFIDFLARFLLDILSIINHFLLRRPSVVGYRLIRQPPPLFSSHFFPSRKEGHWSKNKFSNTGDDYTTSFIPSFSVRIRKR